MHIPDGFINNQVSFGLAASALGAIAHSVHHVRQEIKVRVAVLRQSLATAGQGLKDGASNISFSISKIASDKIRRMTYLSGLIFSLQMLNFPVQNGTSGHFLGAALATAVVGPYAGVLVMTLVVSIQALLFADGGIMALGANLINIAVIPCFIVGWMLTIVRRKYKGRPSWITMATMIIAWFSVVIAATSCSLELALSGTIPLWDGIKAMIPVHMLIGLGEAALTLLAIKLLFPDAMMEREEKGDK